MTPRELLEQARKYRIIASALPPNIPGPQNRDYYLARAVELERLAQPAPAPVTPPAPRLVAGPGPGSAGDTSATRDKPRQPAQVRVHTLLARAVLADKRAHLHRAFSLWSLLRARGETWHYTNDIIREFSQLTSTSERTVRRWLEAGEGIFWSFGQQRRGGQRTLWLKSKDKLFAYYQLEKPGRVALVQSEQLTSKLQKVRAALFSLWLDKDQRWCSRATIQRLTGASERSQRNYDRLNQQHKQPVYCLNGSDKARQLPNRYSSGYSTPNSNVSRGQKRYGLYTPEFNIAESSQANGLAAARSVEQSVGDNATRPARVLFDNAPGALRAAQKRAGAGLTGNLFVTTDTTKRGKVLVRSVGYADKRVFAS